MTRILLVEDDKSIVEKLSEFLSSENFSVDSASGQDEALKKLECGAYDLVLLDISLADGNGFSVCTIVKTEYGIPVIFLTASGDEYSTVTGFNVGRTIVLPFRRASSSSALRMFSGAREERRRYQLRYAYGGAARGRDLCLSALEYRLLLVFSTTAAACEANCWRKCGTSR